MFGDIAISMIEECETMGRDFASMNGVAVNYLEKLKRLNDELAPKVQAQASIVEASIDTVGKLKNGLPLTVEDF